LDSVINSIIKEDNITEFNIFDIFILFNCILNHHPDFKDPPTPTLSIVSIPIFDKKTGLYVFLTFCSDRFKVDSSIYYINTFNYNKNIL